MKKNISFRWKRMSHGQNLAYFVEASIEKKKKGLWQGAPEALGADGESDSPIRKCRESKKMLRRRLSSVECADAGNCTTPMKNSDGSSQQC